MSYELRGGGTASPFTTSVRKGCWKRFDREGQDLYNWEIGKLGIEQANRMFAVMTAYLTELVQNDLLVLPACSPIAPPDALQVLFF